MTAILSRASVLAIMAESSEGTPVVPAGATSFIALQDDFTMEPAFDVLDNGELKSSIGKSQPIIGAENPKASGSHYLRASGSTTAPNYGLLIKSCLGAVSLASTEYDTVSGSAVGVINVDTGEGASFARGQGLLIKDGTNGYRIRCVDSVSTDALSIGFNLPTAPGTGVNLGKANMYYPANSAHPTLTIWHYLGNGGATQMIAGARVTSMSFDIKAGDLINGKYALEALAYYLNPIQITSGTSKLDFTNDDGTAAATIPVAWYKDPHDLASAITTAMNTISPGETATCVYQNSDGKFKITSTGTVLTLKWNTGANTANSIASKIGFSTGADSSGTAAATGYTSTTAQSFAAPYTPSYDSANPLAAKYQECMVGNATDYACFEAYSANVSVSTPRSKIPSVCAQSGIGSTLINSREITIQVAGPLNQFDADKFRKMRTGESTKFQYSFGTKSGGNWVPTTSGVIYAPTATITKCNVIDNDGVASLDLELQCFVDSSGHGEFYINTFVA